MLNLGSNVKLKPPKDIQNKASAGGATAISTLPYADNTNLNQIITLSGALTAATYKEMLTVSGSGVLQLAYVSTVDATSRTVGIKIIIDGTTIFDEITAAITAGSSGILAAGMILGEGVLVPVSYPFHSSLSISIKSSLSETNKIAIGYIYYAT